VTPKFSIPTSYYWGYQNTLPVIKADNVSYLDLNTAVNAALSVVGKNSIDELETAIRDVSSAEQKTLYLNFITSLRNNTLMANAQFTAYTYVPLIGMTSQTDTKGMITYYEYDVNNRLKIIKDQNSNIIKNYEYHYKPTN